MAEPKQLKAIKGGLNVAKRLLADSDEGRLNAIRDAGRAAHEQEAAIRAAKNAEVKKQLANLPARNKKANEALGLYHPVGGGLKLSRPTSGMNATTVADPMFNPPEIGDITPEQLVKEGAALFPLVGDRAAAGRYLTHVGENELEAPVRLTGGPRYMDANYNPVTPEESAAWESGAGRVTALGRQAERAGQGGRPVYGIYTAGSGTNTDFNIMGANALYQQIPYSKITKKAEKEFDQAMRNGTKDFPPIPNWPGIRSPEAQAMLLDKSNGIVRTKLFGTMGKENFQSMGFPDVPATRKAIIEPELLDVPTNEAGFRLARMDTTGRIIENPNIPSDYPAAMAGQVAGKLDVPADYKDIFQSHFDARRLLSQPESGDYYSFSRAHPIQYADEEWLNRLMEQRLLNERRIKEGSYKKGGEVNIDAADARLSKAIAERMSGSGMAEGGSVDIDASDARLQAAINARMGMAGGGGAFKKLDFTEDDSPLQVGIQASKMGENESGGVMANLDMKGAGRLGVGSNLAGRKGEMQSSTMANYSNKIGDLGINANVVKPTDAYKDMLLTNVMASYPIGEGRVSAGMHGNRMDGTHRVTGHSLGYNTPLAGGNLNVNMMKPKEGKPMFGAQYNKSFADGGGAFKKLEFMADGGKLVKGGAKVIKKLLADEAPAVNRDANKAKFLSDSKVKDRLYHGTRSDINKFNPSAKAVTQGGQKVKNTGAMFFSDNPELASQYTGTAKSTLTGDYHAWPPDSNQGGNVMPVYLNMKNPYVIDAEGQMYHQVEDQIAKAKKMGHDGVILNNVVDASGAGGSLQTTLHNAHIVFEPNQIKSAIGNRGTYDIEDADITKAEGGGAFKKLQFMADGGKLVKGAAKIGKRLLADNSLPALEREANLQKFLAESKTPMRLYHGTTATEGGKGKEAIRRIKPSKEGSLGSGVYLTPNTAQASGYSGIPNDEAIISMLGSKYHQDTGLKAMNQRNSGELLPAQEGGNMLPVYAQLRNPLVIEGTHNDPMIEALVKLGVDEDKAVRMVERAYEEKGYIGKQVESRARAAGYDGLMQYRDGDLSEVVSYNPNAVKSATGNQGTYDIYNPDLSKAHGGLAMADGGKLVKGISKVGKKLLADPEKKIIEPPSIIIPSKVSNVKDAMRKRQGEFGARRVERAADEVPNLERMYQEEALKQAFGGDNAKAMMTIDPKDFEKYAMPIPMDIAKNKMYFTDIDKNRTPNMREVFRDSNLTDSEWMALDNREKALLTHQYMRKYNQEEMNHEQYLKHLAGIDDGFSDVPFLQINKQEQGLPLTPFISGHEGRHRNRALAGRGEEKSLVQLIPRSELREPFPRRSQEEYLEALKKELEMTGNKVRPESEDVYGGGQIQQIKRGLIELPDLYAEGGGAFKTLQFKDAQHFDGGGIAIPEMNNSFEGSSREPLLTEKDWANIKRNAPEVYEWAKQNVKDEASQLKTARGVKDFALRTGAQYLGGIPDLVNLGLMGVDALADTNLSSEKPWFGSEQYIDALKRSGAIGENEFPIAETVAGVLAPAGLIKKGVKQLRKPRPKQEPKKRRGGLTAMSR